GEHLEMVAWMSGQVTPTESILERGYDWASHSWIPAVLSWRVPLRRRWELLRNAVAKDPHALRRLIRRPWIVTIQLKLAREFRRARDLSERVRRGTPSLPR